MEKEEDEVDEESARKLCTWRGFNASNLPEPSKCLGPKPIQNQGNITFGTQSLPKPKEPTFDIKSLSKLKEIQHLASAIFQSKMKEV